MAPAIAAAVVVLALLVFVLLGVVVELQRDMRQLRDAAGILDRPLEVELGQLVGAKPSEYGLPRLIDHAGVAVVLFLSDRCGSCHALARGLNGTVPPGLCVVLEARNSVAAAEFLASYELEMMLSEGRVLLDVDGRIAKRMGLRTTPVGFRVENGRFVSATTVPSRRYLASIVRDRVQLDSFAQVQAAERSEQ